MAPRFIKNHPYLTSIVSNLIPPLIAAQTSKDFIKNHELYGSYIGNELAPIIEEMISRESSGKIKFPHILLAYSMVPTIYSLLVIKFSENKIFALRTTMILRLIMDVLIWEILDGCKIDENKNIEFTPVKI